MVKNLAHVVLFAVSSCSTPQFNYRWYGLDVDNQKLLGPVPTMDLPITMCKADEIQKGKCAVFFVDEFDRLRNDYIQMAVRLRECEK